ncbi:MAG: cytidine deaminase [Kiritimatiellia bacterium]
MDIEMLLSLARDAAQKAYAPYSHLTVGAALLGANGTVYCGCNVENASYGLTNCAERTALFKAVSDGCTNFQALAIAAPRLISPCGACRQVMSEFCAPELPVYLTDLEGTATKTLTFGALFPLPFLG